MYEGISPWSISSFHRNAECSKSLFRRVSELPKRSPLLLETLQVWSSSPASGTFLRMDSMALMAEALAL